MVGRKWAGTLMFFIGLANKIALAMVLRAVFFGRLMDGGLIENGGGCCFRTLERWWRIRRLMYRVVRLDIRFELFDFYTSHPQAVCICSQNG